jgi:D-alanyl-D-alanine dipeptidase
VNSSGAGAPGAIPAAVSSRDGKRLWLTLFALIAAALSCQATAQVVPNGFVYLSEIEPSIRQDIRYATPHNFIGRPIAGYGANECILTRKAAQALAQAQAELLARRLSLIVWDCYRPLRAVNDFVAWSRNARDQAMKAEFYPNLAKDSLFALGYIAARSAHSRGSTVDLGIVPADLQAVPTFRPGTRLVACTAPKGERFDAPSTSAPATTVSIRAPARIRPSAEMRWTTAIS